KRLDLFRSSPVWATRRRALVGAIRALRQGDLRGLAGCVRRVEEQQADRRSDDPQRGLPRRSRPRGRVRFPAQEDRQAVQRFDVSLHGAVAAVQLRQHSPQARTRGGGPMIFLDRLFTNGVRFVLNAIVTAAEAELGDSEEALRQELLDAQMRLELGEIDEAAFAEIEAQVLPRLRAIRESQLEQVERARREALSSSDVAVEVEIEGFDSDTQRG